MRRFVVPAAAMLLALSLAVGVGARPAHAFVNYCGVQTDNVGQLYSTYYGPGDLPNVHNLTRGRTFDIGSDIMSYRWDGSDGNCYRGAYGSGWLTNYDYFDGNEHFREWRCGGTPADFNSGHFVVPDIYWYSKSYVGGASGFLLGVQLPNGVFATLHMTNYGRCGAQFDNYTTSYNTINGDIWSIATPYSAVPYNNVYLNVNGN